MKGTVEDLEYIEKHVPYIISDQFREDVSVQQRLKGAVKYPELFNPDSWSDDELANHAMMEFHDGQEYVSGMRTRMRQLRQQSQDKDSIVSQMQQEIDRLENLLSLKLEGDI